MTVKESEAPKIILATCEPSIQLALNQHHLETLETWLSALQLLSSKPSGESQRFARCPRIHYFKALKQILEQLPLNTFDGVDPKVASGLYLVVFTPSLTFLLCGR